MKYVESTTLGLQTAKFTKCVMELEVHYLFIYFRSVYYVEVAAYYILYKLILPLNNSRRSKEIQLISEKG